MEVLRAGQPGAAIAPPPGVRGPCAAARPGAPLLAAVLLAACGFHLQGHTPLPAALRRPYIDSPDRQSEFVQNLRRALLSGGARPALDRDKASAVVTILQDGVARRVLSVSPLNQPNEYEITYTVRFSVKEGTTELLPPQEMSATRSYSFEEPLLLAKGHEEDILRQDMAQDLADRVMRRLASL